MKKILFLFSFLFALNLYAQQDLKWLKIKKYKVATLSESLKETSGLTFFKDKLYTINDGGNTSEIFEIDKNSGKILGKIKTDLKNHDWEAITSNSFAFFVGDFGNNSGSRIDLNIFQIEPMKKMHGLFGTGWSKVVNSICDSIDLQYPEQTDFSKKPQNNNWDAESLIYKEGKLHLFTKEWQSYDTNHYIVNPRNSETQNAQKLETFHLGFLATDASYFNKKLYLIGYTKKMEVYLSVFNEDENGLFFSAKPQKYYLGQTSKLGQIEGIAVNEDGIYISGEEFNLKIFHAKQAFYFISWEKFAKAAK